MTIKILLVDDNPTFLNAVSQFLDMLPDVEVVAQAMDGKQALRLAAELAPDLMLLDISMPEINGIEVARQVQQWPQKPRIVFLSMHDNVAYHEAAQQMGVFAYVGKADFVTGLLPILERLGASAVQAPPSTPFFRSTV